MCGTTDDDVDAAVEADAGGVGAVRDAGPEAADGPDAGGAGVELNQPNSLAEPADLPEVDGDAAEEPPP